MFTTSFFVTGSHPSRLATDSPARMGTPNLMSVAGLEPAWISPETFYVSPFPFGPTPTHAPVFPGCQLLGLRSIQPHGRRKAVPLPRRIARGSFSHARKGQSFAAWKARPLGPDIWAGSPCGICCTAWATAPAATRPCKGGWMKANKGREWRKIAPVHSHCLMYYSRNSSKKRNFQIFLCDDKGLTTHG